MPDLAHIDAIAQAVTEDLNLGTFDLEFTAERLPLVLFDLPDMETLRVSVLAADDEGTVSGRSSTEHDYKVFVVITQKVPATNAAIDPIKKLAQQIGDFWRFQPLTGRDERWLATRILPYPSDRLKRERILAIVVELTFTGTRDK